MKNKIYIIITLISIMACCISFVGNDSQNQYEELYHVRINKFIQSQDRLIAKAKMFNLNTKEDKEALLAQIHTARNEMKSLDFWFRYLEPLTQKQINGPLPVEWETEVFEKFEKPYKRLGAGFTLAAQYLDETNINRDTLFQLLQSARNATNIYLEDSITSRLSNYHHFFLCNRLYLLNLAAIYTTGFDCPDGTAVIPEVQAMMTSVAELYTAFNKSMSGTPLTNEYLHLYDSTVHFIAQQPTDYTQFDHFHFIKDYINPLFALNQQMIRDYKVVSKSLVDYSLNKTTNTIFSKDLYYGQNAKGIFLRVKDSAVLAEIDRLGKMLFFDPILSSNNMRSCASCHKPEAFFTEQTVATSLQIDSSKRLTRNTPSLINADYNHLLMLDGAHYTLQHQTVGVITNPKEMGGNAATVIKKIMSCKEYKKSFTALLAYTPQEKEITLEHIASAITYYYSKFSKGTSSFDKSMNNIETATPEVVNGFNLFMGKAQCATCHFVPQFNGVKPPYVGSEFEVLGVPADMHYTRVSPDSGRYLVNPAKETFRAFRTGSLRNIAHTMPYMHNGVFKTLDEVVDFYNAGGGVGHGLLVPNQTLSADSLHLTAIEKKQLIKFMESLDENVPTESKPQSLPISSLKSIRKRVLGGIY